MLVQVAGGIPGSAARPDGPRCQHDGPRRRKPPGPVLRRSINKLFSLYFNLFVHSRRTPAPMCHRCRRPRPARVLRPPPGPRGSQPTAASAEGGGVVCGAALRRAKAPTPMGFMCVPAHSRPPRRCRTALAAPCTSTRRRLPPGRVSSAAATAARQRSKILRACVSPASSSTQRCARSTLQ